MTETIEVRLGQTEHVAIIDAADAHLIEGWKFYYWKPRSLNSKPRVIAKRFSKGRVEQTWLHRIIVGMPGKQPGVLVRHKDGDGLNCRRSNLEVITNA